MSRIGFGLLLLTFTVYIGIRAEPTTLLAQDGKKKKKEKAEQAKKQSGADKEEANRVVFAFDPGSHTRPISALGFNKDQTKLITIGWDYSIQIWNTSTGERLDIIRLPAYGLDNGFDENRWNQAAISADGAFAAIGGGPKRLFGDKDVPTRLLIVDIANRLVRKIVLPAEPAAFVSCLSFSANGNRLVVGFGGAQKAVYVLDNVIQIMKNPPDAKLPTEPALIAKEMRTEPHQAALSQSGNRLVVAAGSGLISTFDLSGVSSGKSVKLSEFRHAGLNDSFDWSPDESHFAWSWRQKQEYQLEMRSAEGKVIKSWNYRDLSTNGFGNSARAATLRYLDADHLFISARGANPDKGQGSGCFGVVLDPKSGKTTRRYFEEENGSSNRPIGAASTGGMLAATVTNKGLEAAIYRLTDGKVVARCGSRTPMPTIVGWSKDPKTPAIAWADDSALRPWNSKVENLKYAFDLAKMEPAAKMEPVGFDFHRLAIGDWKLTWSGLAHNYLDVKLKQDDVDSCSLQRSRAMTLIPTGAKRPLVAHSVHDQFNLSGSFAYLRDADGKLITELFPFATQHQDMVSSADGRYLLVSTGTHRLSIYRTDGSRFPMFNIVQANGEWVVWSPEGYYAASPGGEKMIGWAESNGANAPVAFYPADKFSKQFRRPDIIKLAFEKGSMKEALLILNTAQADVEAILPPTAELVLVKQNGSQLKVKATAKARSQSRPIQSIELLLDGRPLSEGRGSLNVKDGNATEAEMDVVVPGGRHELRLLVSTSDGASISDPLQAHGPKIPGQQPVLYRVCIGINDYDDASLKLHAATKDAVEVFKAFETYCTGPYNRFGAAKGELILDKNVTRDAVLKSLNEVRKAARPGDLVVVFFAGHGHKQDDQFYLLTREADLGRNLNGYSLSGDDLRKSLGEMGCPVLLFMDACHSAKGAKAFRPATDDLTRSLTDDSVGVTVMAAAMAYEVAKASEENGFFTAGLLKALKADVGVAYDPYERALYTHHIYSVVFSEVRKASNGKQNPFLNSPWTVPPLIVREIAK